MKKVTEALQEGCSLWHMPRLSAEKVLMFWLFLNLTFCWLAAWESFGLWGLLWCISLSTWHLILLPPGTAASLLGPRVYPFLHILSSKHPHTKS